MSVPETPHRIPNSPSAREAMKAEEVQAAESARRNRRMELESLSRLPEFESYLVRHLQDLGGSGKGVLDPVFNVHSNTMIQQEARREVGQNILDELHAVVPALHRKIHDALMNQRIKRLSHVRR